AGCSFFVEMATVTGRSYRDVAVAYLQALEIGGVDQLLRQLHALEDKHRQEGVYRAMERLGNALEDASFYLLGPIAEGGSIDSGKARELLASVLDYVPASSRHRARLQRHVVQLTDAGLSEELALAVARTRFLLIVLDSIEISRVMNKPAEEVLRLRVAVSDAMRMSELQSAISRMKLSSVWDGPAVQSLGRQLEVHAHKMTMLVENGDVSGMIERYGLGKAQALIGRYLEGGISVASLVMLDSQLRRLLPGLSAT
ncbi:MAG TPA: hypothetical protein VM869_26900, partial [Enhygromyxa sp.]|nr:hypothetical protein [Enhygromyxa sp.]